MKVYKFGGTSVGTPDRMKHVAELITADKEKKIAVRIGVFAIEIPIIIPKGQTSEKHKMFVANRHTTCEFP